MNGEKGEGRSGDGRVDREKDGGEADREKERDGRSGREEEKTGG